jgi:FKBP-type peptidyl-prolyl cis-trans isomerase SlyD
MIERIRKNKKAAIVYSIMNKKGEILMEVSPHAPVFYLHGYNNENIVPGLENALEGRREGDEFSIELPFEQAFGPYNKRLVMEVAKEELTPFIDDFWVGGYIERFEDYYDEEISESEKFMREIEGQNYPEGFVIKEIRKNTVILDGNHPYAGMDLIFKVRVVSIAEASILELENGYPRESEEDYDGEY